ncbi:response regulator transcription factor [Caulobacter rhizosphaerae]|uniref:response regulator transcription factor n=1 Tax=Caulobacter rhizosphaerae TaxID=2010972 RepID=UPI0013D2C032|nr:helix-turn-helix transcriptional regulator [Caulobacter rhizosphaerae]
MIERLTERERQILELAARHLTSKQIGPLLGIRPASVDTFMQSIIRKLEVAGRKDAVIAYIAARDARPSNRDDLDFGSSPMAPSEPARPAGVVSGDGHRHPIPAADGALAPTGVNGSAVERRAKAARRLSWDLGSPARRLVAVAIAAMVLSLVTFGAIAVGYGLNQVFDRMLRDHGNQPEASQAK